MKDWQEVESSKRDPLKKQLKSYRGGQFKNIIQATDYLVFFISKGLKLEDLSDFEMKLLEKRYGSELDFLFG